MKKLIALVLALTVLLTSFSAIPISAEAKVKYTKKSIDYSTKYSFGNDYLYAQYLVLSGRSKGVKKINKRLYTTAYDFMKYSKKGENEQMISYIYEYDGFNSLYDTLDIKPAYNKGKIFSVKYYYHYQHGGAPIKDTYGEAFNVKTGKLLKIADLVPKAYNPTTKSGYKKLRKYVYKKLKKKYSSSDYMPDIADTFNRKYDTKKALNDARYVLTSKGKLYMYFMTYDLSNNADGCLFVKIPSKYA